MAIAVGSRAILEQTISAQRVIQLFDDDGDGAVAGTDLATLNALIARADAVVIGMLYNKGFTTTQLTTLVTDPQIQQAWGCIAAQLAGERKTEWLDAQGKGPYEAMGQRARGDLVNIAKGVLRVETEATVGANATISGEYDAPCPPFQFQPDPRTGRQPGGF